MGKKIISIILLLTLVLGLFSGCGPAGGSGKTPSNPQYEAQVIQIEGASANEDEIVALSVSDLRELTQYELDASYKRTTGLTEEFKMSGPTLRDVLALAGADIFDYEGIGVIGKDSYYCLVSSEIIDSTPDEHLLVALNVDGNSELGDIDAPARLAVQGQFGPYWVRQISKIVLYREVPKKQITSVWMFDALAEGIEPYEYEYYGSKDNAIDLEQVFSRLDHVDSKAFFSMKSSDGFLKNEAMNMVKSRYYIKTDGADAPTNVSPYIRLGMNVQHISWFSTNADAAVFPAELLKYMDSVKMGGSEGIPLDELLYEVKVEALKGKNFDILGTDGERLSVSGETLSKGILTYENGVAGVVWDEGAGLENIPELMRIRLSERLADNAEAGEKEPLEPAEQESSAEPETPAAQNEPAETNPADSFGIMAEGKNVVLTVEGDALSRPLYLSLEELKALETIDQVFSVVNNWPTRKMAVARGVTLESLLEIAGVKDNAALVKLEAADGYAATVTMGQLREKRYAFPKVQSMSIEGGYEVYPMIAWAFEDGTTDISKAAEGNLKFQLGQRGLNDVNTAVSVSMLSRINVLSEAPAKWEAAAIVRDDHSISFEHPNLDQVKIYYTLDGSEPDENSLIYNPSTSYFQPDLIKAIEVERGVTVRAKIFGYGRAASDIFVSEGAK